jgi:hypothetical protein
VRRVAALALFAAGVVAAACTNLDTAPGHVVSIFVDTLPYPSIVQNDTLRDMSGRIVPLKATAFNLAGDTNGVLVQFFSLDANLLRISLGTNFAVAGDSAPSSVRVVAQAQSLQTQPVQVAISLRPDTVAPDSVPNADTTAGAPLFKKSDTTQLVRGFCNGAPISSALVALLLDRPSAGAALLGVDNFIMKWKIVSPDTIFLTGSPNDTTNIAFFVGTDLVTPSIRDTTKGGGLSTRFLEFGGRAFNTVRRDTDTVAVTVQGFATYKFSAALQGGTPVPGNFTAVIKFTNPSKC